MNKSTETENTAECTTRPRRLRQEDHECGTTLSYTIEGRRRQLDQYLTTWGWGAGLCGDCYVADVTRSNEMSPNYSVTNTKTVYT